MMVPWLVSFEMDVIEPISNISSAFSRIIWVPSAILLPIFKVSAAVFLINDCAPRSINTTFLPFLIPFKTFPSFLYSSKGRRIKSATPVPILSKDLMPEIPEAMLGSCVLYTLGSQNFAMASNVFFHPLI